MQNKKEYAFNQSYARRRLVFPDLGQTEKKRGESHEWALMFILPVKFLAELYPMASILIQISIFFY